MKINFVRTRNVKTPEYGTNEAAALDFFVPNDMEWESATLRSGDSLCIPSGICVELPPGTCLVALNKSSLGKQGLNVGACLVDSDYRGEIHLNVFNQGKEPILVKAGQKLVQFIVLLHLKIELHESKYLTPTNRGSNGFGSTGLD